jgi:hypothetical protein
MRKMILPCCLCISGLILCLASLPVPVCGQTQDTLLPEEIVDAVIAHVSGDRALEQIRNISRFRRDPASRAYHEAAEYVAATLEEIGISDVRIESYPADGKKFYYMSQSGPGWDAEMGELWLVEPHKERITSFAEIPASLCPKSQNTHARAELVFVGSGTRDEDYENKDVEGKVVLGYGHPGAIHNQAVFKRGALGVVSYLSDRPLDYPDVVKIASIRPYRSKDGRGPTFGFTVSHRRGEQLRQMLAGGKTLVVEAKVKAELYASAYENVIAVIPGTDLKNEEIVLTAHLCHNRAGSNDNASGSASLIEIARTIKELTAKGEIPPLRRTLRFIWVPENIGNAAFAATHPEIIDRMVCGINMDMVSQYLNENNATYFFLRTPDSLPHYLNDVVANFADFVGRTNTEGLDFRYSLPDPIVSLTGSRDNFRYKIVPFEGGSDQYIYNDSGIGVPMVFFLVWPDAFYHSHQDNPDKCDPTTLKRGGFIAAASAIFAGSASAQEALPLTGEVLWRGLGRISADMERSLNQLNSASQTNLDQAYKEAVNIIEYSFLREKKTLQSIRELDPASSKLQEHLVSTSENLLAYKTNYLKNAAGHYAAICERHERSIQEITPTAEEKAADKIVYERNPELKGPLGSAYLRKQLGPEADFSGLQLIQRGSLISYETLNFVDGQNSVLDIRNAVSAEYEPVPLNEVADFLALLAEAGIINQAGDA